MTDVTSVATVPRVEARTADGRRALLQGGQLPPVAVQTGIPGRDGRDGKDGKDGAPGPAGGEYADPGDLTLIFDNKLVG